MHSHQISHKRRQRRQGFSDGGNDDDDGGSKPQSTSTRTIYMTLSPTFSGEVGGYTTIVDEPKPATTSSQKTTKSATATSTSTRKSSSSSKASTKTTSIPSGISSPTNTDSIPSTLTTSSSSSQISQQEIVSPTPSISSTANDSESDSSSGSSVGSKVGIAFGVLAAVLLVFVLVWFVVRRRREKDEKQRMGDDERLNGTGFNEKTASVITRRTNPDAPRLSLRPVTQFLPGLLEKRTSKGTAAVLSAAGAVSHPAQSAQPSRLGPNDQSAWERPATSMSTHPDNPFGNNAERAISPNPAQAPALSTHAEEVDRTPSSSSSSSPPPTSMRPESPVAGMVASNLVRKQSIRKDGPAPLDLTVPRPPLMAPVPGSPSGTEYSVNMLSPSQDPASSESGSAVAAIGGSESAAAIAAAGGPTGSTVHRVQLDFAPTLEDEMELKAGQLVRLLHEYDDGWALCIRLDRSHQGVVPRTCLSARPVKPRPQQSRLPVNPSTTMANQGRRPQQGPGPQQHGRPMSPPGGPPSSQPPAGSRPRSTSGNAPPKHQVGRKPVPGRQPPPGAAY